MTVTIERIGNRLIVDSIPLVFHARDDRPSFAMRCGYMVTLNEGGMVFDIAATIRNERLGIFTSTDFAGVARAAVEKFLLKGWCP